MAGLMFIGFDNSWRLRRNIYYFEYRSVRFKLIQNNCRKWQDVLITILSDFHDASIRDKIYAIASEFLCALSWENKSRVTIQNLGSRSCPNNQRLRKTKCQFFDFPRIAFPGHYAGIGYDISSLPHIETDEQRTALLLYRDALSSNNNYLSFLFYWQILEVGGTNAIGWTDKIIRKRPPQLKLSRHDIQSLPSGTTSVGNYLYNDCRCAIAHIRRKPGERKLLLDSASDAARVAVSTRIVKDLAELYIENHLGLTRRLWLVRKNSRAFPVYVDEEDMRRHGFHLAYKA
jgi:hypothetical protein